MKIEYVRPYLHSKNLSWEKGELDLSATSVDLFWDTRSQATRSSAPLLSSPRFRVTIPRWKAVGSWRSDGCHCCKHCNSQLSATIPAVCLSESTGRAGFPATLPAAQNAPSGLSVGSVLRLAVSLYPVSWGKCQPHKPA